MSIVLTVNSQPKRLTAAKNTIGRSPQCELPIPDTGESVISWEHACLEYRNNCWMISDKASTNGTFLNGTKLAPNTPTVLRVGDKLRLGMKGPELVIQKLEAIVVVSPPPVQAPPPVQPFQPAPEPAYIPMQNQAYPESRQPSYDEPDDFAERSAARRKPAKESRHPTNTEFHRVVTRLSGEKRTATILAILGLAAGVLAIGVIVAVYVLKPTPVPEDKATIIINKLSNSSVWIICPSEDGYSQGSGCLIEGPERYILTADHVIAGEKVIKVAFARKKADGSGLETNRELYVENSWLLNAEVVRQNAEIDLALLKFKGDLPSHTVPIKIAENEPKIGENCHTVANQGNSDLWVYNFGKINQIQFRDAVLDKGLHLKTWMYQSSVPINPGDSGGPLVNDSGELIGVHSWVGRKLNTFNNHVALRVIKAFIAGQPIPGQE